MYSFYNILISLFVFGIKVFSLFNEKTRKGVEGREKSLSIVKKAFSSSDKVLWMHAASLGEYEQGLPVLEKLKAQFPDYKILITFFSPSGYENVIKKKSIADAICYLPFDQRNSLQEFVSSFDVKIFFTVKYDYWYNLLMELKKRNTRIFVISALFYEKQVFFTSCGKWFVKQLQQNIDWFFHQTNASYTLAESIGLVQSSVTGDTRFDRVKQLRSRNNHVDFIADFIAGEKAIVLGSSWHAEEKIAELILGMNMAVKIIIAPHDLKRIKHLKQIFPDSLLYSEAINNPLLITNQQLLIIDSIGLLSKLYSYADIAVVGGGFHDAGLHNILEAATFGVPVIFGNHYRKNPEADELIHVNGGKSFENESLAADFILFLLAHDEVLEDMSENAYRFVTEKPNSSELIVEKIRSF